MGTGEIIPSEEQAEEEIIISAPNQHEDTALPKANAEDELIIAPIQPEDNAQPEVNAEAEDNDLQGQNIRPVHPRVANEVHIEKIIDNINAPGPLTCQEQHS